MAFVDQLQFVQKFLRNMNVPCHVVKKPSQHISPQIDLGLRALLYDCGDYISFLTNSMSEAKSNTVYRFFDEYRCNYIFMRLPGEESYFFIGPYLLETISKDFLYEKTKELSLPCDKTEQMQQYYAALPILEEENLLFAVANTLAEVIWGGPEQYNVEYIEYMIPDRAVPVKMAPDGRGGAEIPFSLSVLEENYANEKRLMEAVSQGQLHKVNVIASTVFNNGTQQRLKDSLRNRKNYLIILNTLLRKAAEYGGVHPLYIHRISSRYAAEIETIGSVKTSLSLQEEMIRGYCMLVKKHSLNKYSYIVGKTITMIHFDIQANLSLRRIAEQLNVTPTYLSALFKKECGCTLTEYINKTRIEHAAHLLCNTNKQVQNIAGECGIQDTNYFVRLFRRYTGMTPTQYRKLR